MVSQLRRHMKGCQGPARLDLHGLVLDGLGVPLGIQGLGHGVSILALPSMDDAHASTDHHINRDRLVIALGLLTAARGGLDIWPAAAPHADDVRAPLGAVPLDPLAQVILGLDEVVDALAPHGRRGDLPLVDTRLYLRHGEPVAPGCSASPEHQDNLGCLEVSAEARLERNDLPRGDIIQWRVPQGQVLLAGGRGVLLGRGEHLLQRGGRAHGIQGGVGVQLERLGEVLDGVEAVVEARAIHHAQVQVCPGHGGILDQVILSGLGDGLLQQLLGRVKLEHIVLLHGLRVEQADALLGGPGHLRRGGPRAEQQQAHYYDKPVNGVARRHVRVLLVFARARFAYCLVIMISVRRFLARPARVRLLSMGLVSPKPLDSMRLSETPWPDRYLRTESARF